MKMRSLTRNLGIVAIGAVALSSSSNLWAGSCSCKSKTTMMRDQGTIESLETKSEALILKDRNQATLDLRYDHHTRFFERNGYLERGKPITSTDLKPGEWVRVSYDREGGNLVAKTVVVIPNHRTTS